MMDGVPSKVNVLLREVSNPGLMFFSWKVSNPSHWHQKLQEDEIGTQISATVH